MAHVQHALVVDDLAVGERHRAAGHHEPEAGPVRRGDRLAEGRVAGPVAVDAGDEGGRRRDRRALLERPARAGLAVGDREPRLDLALAERVEALDLEPPRRVGRRLREALLRDDLTHRELVVQDVEELDRAAAGVQHLRRHAGRLRADADVHGPAQLRDEHGRVGALPVGDGAEGVAEHEQVLRLAAAARHEPARHRVHGVALAGEADVDVPDVAGDGRVREAGLAAQLARQLHALRAGRRRSRRRAGARRPRRCSSPTAVPGGSGQSGTRSMDSRLRWSWTSATSSPAAVSRSRRASAVAASCSSSSERGLAPLEQARAGRADDVDLGAAREIEEETALDAGPRAQLLVHVGDVGAADDGDVHAERREPLHAAAHRRGVGVAARHGGAVPREADDGELAVERALQPPGRARCRPLSSLLVAARRHRPTILPHARLSCTGTVHLSSCHDRPEVSPCPRSTSPTSAASSPRSGGWSTASPPPTSTGPAARRRRSACSTRCSTTSPTTTATSTAPSPPRRRRTPSSRRAQTPAPTSSAATGTRSATAPT